MSIKPDAWIRRQCLPPTHSLLYGDKVIKVFTPNTQQHLEDVQRRASVNNLTVSESIKHDIETVNWKPMISPFIDGQVRQNKEKKVVSYGTSSYGYDVRLSNKFKIFTNVNNAIIDPLDVDEQCFVEHEGECCIIPPNSYILGHTIETFCIPRDVMVLCVGKSTYARCAAIINVTPIEAGFEGQVVIEISNASNLPLKVYANQGIAQFMFFQSDEACEVSYADRDGKYQGQSGIVTARV